MIILRDLWRLLDKALELHRRQLLMMLFNIENMHLKLYRRLRCIIMWFNIKVKPR